MQEVVDQEPKVQTPERKEQEVSSTAENEKLSPTNTRDKIKYVSFINQPVKQITPYRTLEQVLPGDGTATPSFMKKTDVPAERINVSQDGGCNFIKVASESGIPTSDKQLARSSSNTR